MNDCSVGDDVEYLGRSYLVAKRGATARIERKGNEFIYLKWYNNSLRQSQQDGGYVIEGFKVVNLDWDK